MGYEDFLKRRARIYAENQEKSTGESLNELLIGDEESSYIASEIFEITGCNDLAEKILKGEPLDQDEANLSLRIREEIVVLKKDVQSVYDSLRQGRMLEDLAPIGKYFGEIRQRVGLNNMDRVIQFEDLVQMRIYDEHGFSQLKNALAPYDALVKRFQSKDERLKKLAEGYGISQKNLEELMLIPAANRAELEKKVKELVNSKNYRYAKIPNLLKAADAEKEIMDILAEAIQDNRQLVKERNKIAECLKNIIEGNTEIRDMTELNIARVSGEVPENPKKTLGFKESRDLYGAALPSIDQELSGEEAENKIAIFWGEKFRSQKAIEVSGRHLTDREVDNFWTNLPIAQFTAYQNECFQQYKEKFLKEKLEKDKNEGSWFDRVLNIVSSIIGTKRIEDVSLNCRSRMRRNR